MTPRKKLCRTEASNSVRSRLTYAEEAQSIGHTVILSRINTFSAILKGRLLVDFIERRIRVNAQRYGETLALFPYGIILL